MDWFFHFFDPGQDGFDGEDFLRILIAIGAIYGGLAVVRRWIMRRVEHRAAAMEQRILDALKPIQPDANGGKSLPDLHKKLDSFVDFTKTQFATQDQVNDLLIARQATIADELYRHTQDRHGKDA